MNKLGRFFAGATLCSSLAFPSLSLAWEIYHPTGRSEIVNRTSTEALTYLTTQFTGTYTITTHDDIEGKSETKTATVTLEEQADEQGVLQPAIKLKYGPETVSLYLTNIEEIAGASQNNSNHLIFSYHQKVAAPMPYSRITFYDFVLVGDPAPVTEGLLALVHEPLQLSEKVAQPLPPALSLPTLTSREQENICLGLSVEGKTSRLLTQLIYEECSEKPAASDTTLLKEVPKYAVLLICGNATIPSGRRCDLSAKDFGNDSLAWKRAVAGATNLEAVFRDKKVTIHLYNNGTKLNKRSADIYLVEENRSNLSIAKRKYRELRNLDNICAQF